MIALVVLVLAAIVLTGIAIRWWVGGHPAKPEELHDPVTVERRVYQELYGSQNSAITAVEAPRPRPRRKRTPQRSRRLAPSPRPEPR